MTAIADLLARIVVHPDDDDARAVYADALCEAGDPRGELINVERELAKLGIETMDDLVFSPIEGDSLAHATQLLRRAIALRPDSTCWRRGFITTIQSGSSDVIARAIESSPIDCIVLESGASIAELLKLSLARIRRLYVRWPTDPEMLPALFAALPHLESLVLLCPLDVRMLEPCRGLRELAADEIELATLCTLPCAQTLRVLKLSRTPGAFGVASRLPALDRLELDSVIEPSADRLPREVLLRSIVGPDRLAELPALASVEVLDVGVAEIPEDEMFSIINSRYLRAVKRLALRGPASDRAFRAIVHMRGGRLEWLSLDRAQLLPGDARRDRARTSPGASVVVVHCRW